MPAFEWVHVQLHQQKGMISLSPPTICNSAAEVSQAEAKQHGAFVEDALTEADALAAVGQDERQEERA
ncbi:hypothetical protein IER86_004711 [Salmonella enterica subsp. enterica serovar Dublin]|nr:hypothetical protein [Salmonella enterica subsp. enterica serovar Dublin]EGK0935698.1 hypothetical protein [Salmonella enterica]